MSVASRVQARLFGVLGDPVAHSLSPAMQNAALAAARRPLRGAPAVLIGAGGSARAVGAALVHAGCGRLTVANRTPGRGEHLAARVAALGCPDTRAITLAALAGGDPLADAALVVNTTPLGLGGAGPALRYAASPPRCLFVDLVYGAEPTPFLAAAARARR